MQTLLVLAGGFGSRLRSAVSDVPKPLAPVANQPFLKYLLKNLISQGADDIVLLLHFEANKIEDMVETMKKDGHLNGIKIRTLIEKKPLGTGGAIANALSMLKLKDSFIVVNADTWISSGLDLLANSEHPCLASVKINNCDRYGYLDIVNNKILSFNEKQPKNINGWINAGMYHFDISNFIDYQEGSFFSLEEIILPKLVNSSELNVIQLETEFIDIGVPVDYLRFCEWIEKGKKIEL
jgi:NDP-sugar pyrophosphorylase family protein